MKDTNLLGEEGRLVGGDLAIGQIVGLAADQHDGDSWAATLVRWVCRTSDSANATATATATARQPDLVKVLLGLEVRVAGCDAIHDDEGVGESVPATPQKGLLLATLGIVVEAVDDKVCADLVDVEEVRLGGHVLVPVGGEQVLLRREPAMDELGGGWPDAVTQGRSAGERSRMEQLGSNRGEKGT